MQPSDCHKQKLKALSMLAWDWDSYGALPITQTALDTAQIILDQLIENKVLSPAIVPTRDGGVQLEWHVRGWDVEWEIHNDGIHGEAFWETSNVWTQVDLPQQQEQLMQVLKQHLSIG